MGGRGGGADPWGIGGGGSLRDVGEGEGGAEVMGGYGSAISHPSLPLLPPRPPLQVRATSTSWATSLATPSGSTSHEMTPTTPPPGPLCQVGPCTTACLPACPHPAHPIAHTQHLPCPHPSLPSPCCPQPPPTSSPTPRQRRHLGEVQAAVGHLRL